MKIIAVCTALLGLCASLFADAPVATVPFRWVRNQIILKVEMDGSAPLNFQLDTGANPSLVDLDLAQRRGLILRPARRPATVDSGSLSLDYVAPLHHLHIGDLDVDSLFAMTVDLTHASHYIGLPLSGVLGYSFLQNRILQIDYRRHVVRFYDNPPDADPGPNGATMPMMMLEGETTPLVRDLTMDGNPLLAGIDTGSSYGVLLFSSTVDALGLDPDGQNIRADSVLHGEGDETDILLGHRATVQIDSMRFHSVGVGFTREGWSGQGTDLWDGTLGNAFFQSTRLTLDYKNGTIAIER